MLIYPAIDLRAGCCVRLLEGRFDAVTHYADDPAAQLDIFADAGAEWLHVVDLDGAQAGSPQQHEIIGKLAQRQRLKIQAGGGVRSAGHIARLLDTGVARVVVGSTSVREPDLVRSWLARFGSDRLTLAFDVRLRDDDQPFVVTDGWASSSALKLEDALSWASDAGAVQILVTDVSRDGALKGPNHALIAACIRGFPVLQFQASGGVTSLDDLDRLAQAGAAGAIVGKALYEGRIDLAEAIHAR